MAQVNNVGVLLARRNRTGFLLKCRWLTLLSRLVTVPLAQIGLSNRFLRSVSSPIVVRALVSGLLQWGVKHLLYRRIPKSVGNRTFSSLVACLVKFRIPGCRLLLACEMAILTIGSLGSILSKVNVRLSRALVSLEVRIMVVKRRLALPTRLVSLSFVCIHFSVFKVPELLTGIRHGRPLPSCRCLVKVRNRRLVPLRPLINLIPVLNRLSSRWPLPFRQPSLLALTGPLSRVM